MGTSIECYFARDVDWEPKSLARRLDDLCATFATQVEAIRNYGQFSRGNASWYVVRSEGESGESDYLFGEGPSGLSIWVHRRVVCLGSAERFGALYDASHGVSAPLRHLICSLAASLTRANEIAVAAAGMGDTDRAEDVASYDGGSFDDLCRELRRFSGDPTNDWNRLGERRWYLGPAIAV